MSASRMRLQKSFTTFFRASDCPSLQRRPHCHCKLADTLDLAFKRVARDGGRNARGGAGHDDVAGGERHHLGQLLDHLRDLPDHLRQIAVLAKLAIAFESDAARGRMADLCCRRERAAWRRRIERFADFPWPFDVARSDLQVAAGKVDADAVAPDQLVSVGGPEEAASVLEGHQEFNLVMQIPRE